MVKDIRSDCYDVMIKSSDAVTHKLCCKDCADNRGKQVQITNLNYSCVCVCVLVIAASCMTSLQSH